MYGYILYLRGFLRIRQLRIWPHLKTGGSDVSFHSRRRVPRKYPSNEVFKKRNFVTEFNPENLGKQNIEIAVYNENIFTKIMNKIKSIFKK